MLFERMVGRVRHSGSFNDAAIKSVADTLARLHLLGESTADSFLGHSTYKRGDDAALMRESDILLQRMQSANVSRERAEIVQESMSYKICLLRDGLKEDNFKFLTGHHFVHGDCHNENMLFDAQGEMVGLVDFEASYIGDGARDVASFVLMALVDANFSQHSLLLARRFVETYRCVNHLSSERIRAAIDLFFCELVKLTFFEQKIAEGRTELVPYLRRDCSKIRRWMASSLQIYEGFTG